MCDINSLLALYRKPKSVIRIWVYSGRKLLADSDNTERTSSTLTTVRVGLAVISLGLLRARGWWAGCYCTIIFRPLSMYTPLGRPSKAVAASTWWRTITPVSVYTLTLVTAAVVGVSMPSVTALR